MRVIQCVGLACFAGLVFAGGALGATRHVNATNATPGAPYLSLATAATNIQQAIDASNTGDEILVAPGTYRVASSVTIPDGKALTLRSTQSRAATIDAQRLCPALVVMGTNSVVEGFTIRNGVSPDYGGGVVIFVESTVRDCLITSNRAYGGAGIVFFKPGLAENCTVQSNLATYWAGGVSFYNNSSGRVNRCHIINNVASNYGGGVAIQYGGTVSNSWIADNRAILGHGGGVHLDQGGRLVNCVVVGNRAQVNGGGVYNISGIMAHCTVVSNTAEGFGGGLYENVSTNWNNIIYYNAAGSYLNVFRLSLAFSNNCTMPLEGGTNFTNAPTFVNYAGRDFHLTSTSSCLERGATNPAVKVDYDGVTRPQQATLAGAGAYDVGAFEFRMYWDAGFTDIGGGWRRLNWFGDYAPMGNGWVWHNKHGFWYPTVSSYEYDIWFYTQDMGWLWTSRTQYPFLFRSSDGAWLWYNGATNPRWFRNMTAGTWESRP